MNRMATVTFDTLGCAQRMQNAGMPAEQANVLATVRKEVAFDQLVTKQDLTIALKDLEQRLTLRMGAMSAATITILGALIAFHH